MQASFRPDLKVTASFQNGMQIEKILRVLSLYLLGTSLEGNGAGKCNVGMLICRKVEMIYMSSQGKRSNVSLRV